MSDKDRIVFLNVKIPLRKRKKLRQAVKLKETNVEMAVNRMVDDYIASVFPPAQITKVNNQPETRSEL